MRRLDFDLGQKQPSQVVVGKEVSPETEGPIKEGETKVEGASNRVEQQDIPTCAQSARRRAEDDDGLSPNEAELADYSLTNAESNDALEIPPE